MAALVWREIPPSNILIEVARRVTRVTLTSSMTSSRVTRDDSEEMTCGASMTRDDGNCRPEGPRSAIPGAGPTMPGKIRRDCWSCHCQGGPEIPDPGAST